MAIAPRRYIGTAGWGIPAAYADDTRSGGSHLERYARCFNAVEINSSFHRSHQPNTYARWAASTPDDFRFSVKVPKSVTHERRLADCGALLDRFAAEVAGLGDKLGAVLVQLPPTALLQKRVAGGFFKSLQRRLSVAVVLEPRHASWFASGIGEWLAARGIVRVAADPPRVDGAGEPAGWEGVVYFRWHGAPRIYYSAYEDAALAALQVRIAAAGKHGADCWCIFDNTAAGAAFGDARRLRAVVDGAPPQSLIGERPRS
jgi:uncharacterized protein YecE (DUF72 family)